MKGEGCAACARGGEAVRCEQEGGGGQGRRCGDGGCGRVSTRRPCAAGTGAGGAEEVQKVVDGRVGEGRGVRGVRGKPEAHKAHNRTSVSRCVGNV